MATRVKRGDWNVQSDSSGFKKKASEVKKRWDGLYVDKEDWEQRHPLDFIRFPSGTESVVPFTRPEGEDVEQDTSSWLGTKTAIPDGTNNGSL